MFCSLSPLLPMAPGLEFFDKLNSILTLALYLPFFLIVPIMGANLAKRYGRTSVGWFFIILFTNTLGIAILAFLGLEACDKRLKNLEEKMGEVEEQ